MASIAPQTSLEVVILTLAADPASIRELKILLATRAGGTAALIDVTDFAILGV